MADSSEPLYKVDFSDVVRASLQGLLAEADRLDSRRRTQLGRALATILHKLKTDPLNWGEPEYPLRGKGLTVYHGVFSVVHTYYTVFEDRRVVVIQNIGPVPSFDMELGPDENR